MTVKEIWKPVLINNKKTDYLVSNFGKVYSKKSNKILKQEVTKVGYARVTIFYNKTAAHKSIHRLVANAFIYNDDKSNKIYVNHINGNKLDNSVNNLEWVTARDNELHAYKNNLKVAKHGDESHLSVYSKKQVISACEMMEEGIFTIKYISYKTGISESMLYLIQKRRSWINISRFYDVENCKYPKNSYSLDQIEYVFKLLEENKLSIYEISDCTNVKTSTIHNIVIHKNNKYSYLYDLYNIDLYTPKILKPLDTNIQNDIINMIKNNNDIQTITNIISKKYSVNKDRIHDYTNRLKKKIGSTTIESIT